MQGARDLSDELENLTPEEREQLKGSLDDIIRDSPQATVAATRFKRLAAKAGRTAADGLKEIMIDLVSETAKKIIWPT